MGMFPSQPHGEGLEKHRDHAVAMLSPEVRQRPFCLSSAVSEPSEGVMSGHMSSTQRGCSRTCSVRGLLPPTHLGADGALI